MQLPQPLALLHVALAPWQVPGISGIHHKHFEPRLFQYFLNPQSVHPGGLHHHRPNAALFQPLRHLLQGPGPAAELAYRLRIPPRGHRYKMALFTDVDASRIGMHDLQTGVFAGQHCQRLDIIGHLACELSTQFFPLFTVHLPMV